MVGCVGSIPVPNQDLKASTPQCGGELWTTSGLLAACMYKHARICKLEAKKRPSLGTHSKPFL